MNTGLLKIILFLGLIMVIFSGCESRENNQMNEKKNIFQPLEKMFGIEEQNFINLEGNWRFSIGDDTTWASPYFNDNNWEKIKVPGNWEDQGFHGYNGYAWYRKTFELPKELIGSNFILNMGYVDDADQTFINGKLIGVSGSFPPWFMTAYDAYRNYYIPKELLTEGKNIIAIRVYDSELEGGIKGGAIGLSQIKSDAGSSSDPDLDINLSGMWKFKTGDNNLWKDNNIDDKYWREIFVPAFWESQGFRKYNGFAWYRIKRGKANSFAAFDRKNGGRILGS